MEIEDKCTRFLAWTLSAIESRKNASARSNKVLPI